MNDRQSGRRKGADATCKGGGLLLQGLQHALVALVEEGDVGETHFAHQIVESQGRVEPAVDGHLAALARSCRTHRALHGAHQETLLHSDSFACSKSQ